MTDHDNTAPLILFVDDEATAVKYFQRAIDTLAPVVTASTVEEGRRMLDKHASTLAVLVTDQRMPGGYGNELLQYASVHYPHMVRILTTAYSELDHTIEAVNQGQIHRYIQKPWEISALRMELKQALELAALRKDHDELLREKMTIRQKQMLSHRIGTIHTLCATLGSAENFAPVEAYLTAAAAAYRPSEMEWITMDHPELVSCEAIRSGRFGNALRNRLTELRQQQTDPGKLLSELPLDKAAVPGDNAVVLADEGVFAEFLQASCNAPVSAQHVSWLAYLIRLSELGGSLQLASVPAGMQCRTTTPATPISPSRLAHWIEQFCEM